VIPETNGYPLRLDPIFVERVWGAPIDSDAVAVLYPARPPEPKRVGEVWLTGDANRIANGTWSGKTLREVTRACGPALLGNAVGSAHPSGQPVFPLLVKFLFTSDKLSVQLHPPDHYAAREGSWGKTEMWHVLRAEPGARLAIGFRPDISSVPPTDPGTLRTAIARGTIEQMLNWMEVSVGDTFFIPAGTVHAIGGGLTLCEIQQNSDITYRLYDYDRPGTDGQPRALHVEQALEVVRWQTEGGRTKPARIQGPEGPRLLLAACPYFSTERWEIENPVVHSPSGHIEIWIALAGQAELEASGERVRSRQGDVIIVPTEVKSLRIEPWTTCAFLRTYLPDWQRDILAPLRAAGIEDEGLREVCFPMLAAEEKLTR
jgi:mannose-6-phosphate isomerase